MTRRSDQGQNAQFRGLVKETLSISDERNQNVQTPDPSYLKVRSASQYLGISPNSLRKYTDLGLIQAKRLPGGDRIYKRTWLDQFVEKLPDATEMP